MARIRISTTVDESLLAEARRLRAGQKDAALMDEALQALVRQHRDAEISAAYLAEYTAHPDDEPDEWGDLVSWSEAVREAP
ncbi:MAG: type II toxin-antitoxin system VapB family antitoxin [Aquihabitans sp.]